MKQIAVFTFIVLIIGVVGIGLVLVQRSKNIDSQFILIKEFGTVYYGSQESYKELTNEEITLQSGTYVKTKDANAHIILPNNSLITLDVDTEIQVTYNQNSTEISQLVGSTWHRVKNISGNEKYEVITPDVVAAVRGTIFAVGTNNDESSTYVIESEVEVSSYEIEGDNRVIKQSNLVNQDKHISFRNQIFNLTDLPEEIKAKEWFKRNKILDQEISLTTKDQIRDRIRTVLRDNDELQNLRDKIKDRLNENFENNGQNYEDYPVLGVLKERYDIEIHEELICQKVSENNLNNDLNRLEEVPDAIFDKKDEAITYLTALNNACSDGKIDEDEKYELRTTSQNIGQVVNMTPFHNEITAKIESYIKFEGDGSLLCLQYVGKTVSQIESEFTEIEERYSAQPVAATQHHAQITNIKAACSNDGIIDQNEMGTIYGM